VLVGEKKMKAYRTILAVDRYELLAEGRLLANRYPNLLLAGEAAIGIELLTLLHSASAEMVLFFLAAPNREKLEMIKTVTRRFPHLKLLYGWRSKGPCQSVDAPVLPPLSGVPNQGRAMFLPVTRLI
jgi:hypothetical protein